MVGFKILFTLCAFAICFCASAYVDTLQKCGKSDAVCQKKLLQSVLKSISKTGIPELDIPQIDPIQLKGFNVAILDLVNITLVDGVAKGVKDCTVNKFEANFDDLHASIELVCDITIKGHYSVYSGSPLIKNFLGGDNIHGDGNGKAKIEKFKVAFDFDFTVEKRGDDLFIKSSIEKMKYTYDVLGKMVFAADNLYVGNKEQSASIVKLMNENWRILMDMVGKQFVEKAMNFVFNFTQKFFSNVPTKNYILDDLENYVSS
ncbi:uncharacterized protein LOC100301495 precursor [Bombyx mori]|uniref:Odorant binding protein n=1 Tax=Bombyx mori TaxID=7091 RepID=C0SQ82_BOMMO|nr:uncharacterized protein LOC100301495 precursor [Bombyx mori]BAH36761.1 odorant binding protein [Bombyx mori]